MPHVMYTPPRSRSPRRQRHSSNSVIHFGRHQGLTFQDVVSNHPGYCTWALNVTNPTGGLRDFAQWLRQRQRGTSLNDLVDDLLDSLQAPEDSDDSDEPLTPQSDTEGEDEEEEHEDDAETPSFAKRRAKQQSIDISNRLPQIEYSVALFSGEPHPESCSICMEDFAPSESAPSKGLASDATCSKIILLTPCLHVYHQHCLRGWLERNRFCPSCRWDLCDTGESAVRSKDSMAPPPVVAAPAELVGTTLEISDDE